MFFMSYARIDACMHACMHPGETPNTCSHFSICACHPCAGAMLIFSVSFQCYRMIPGGNPCMYVFMYVCMYVCKACTFAYIYAYHMHTFLHACAHACIHACMHVGIQMSHIKNVYTSRCVRVILAQGPCDDSPYRSNFIG